VNTSPTDQNPPPPILQGKRVAFVGKLASMGRREACQLARRHGAVVVDKPSAAVDLLVLGEEEFPWPDLGDREELFDDAMREAVDSGRLEVVTETQLWHRLGLVDEGGEDVHRLYTPAMLARLLDVPLAIVRRWHRRGLIVPVRKVRRLPYFDFQEVATARHLADLLAAGTSPRAIEKKLAALARYLPDVQRPLAQLSVIIQGKDILLRQGDGLVEPGGQLRFDFGAPETVIDAVPCPAGERPRGVLSLDDYRQRADAATSPEEICRMAAELEEDGELEAAAEMYRAANAAGGPRADVCFQLAELLYRLGDLAGARERYYMAVELDEDYVEARGNLGCILAEMGQRELAAAALAGALAYHPDYADAHYHLARLLDEQGKSDEARAHWQAFVDQAPGTPWAEEARHRLERPTR